MPNFKATLEDIKEIKVIVNTIQKMVGDIPFFVNKDEFKVHCMDASHAAMINLTIEKEEFSSYSCKKEQLINVSSDMLSKILGRHLKGDSITFESEQDEFTIKFKGKKRGERSFSIPIFVEKESSKLPSHENVRDNYQDETNVILKGGYMNDILSDVGILAESFTMISQKDLLRVIGVGPDNKSMESKITTDLEDVISLDIPEPKESTYGLEYMKNIQDLDKIVEKVTLEFDTAKPLLCTFQITNHAEFVYLLAPYEEPQDEVEPEKEE
jgi:DNA polymerase III sliding clamp (beta) subunit (PCNA family)